MSSYDKEELAYIQDIVCILHLDDDTANLV